MTITPTRTTPTADPGVVLRGAQDRFDHVRAVRAAHPAGPDDEAVGTDVALAGELGSPVDRGRIRFVGLDVGFGLRAVEHVVGRHVDDAGTDAGRRFRDMAGSDVVDRGGAVLVGFAQIDGGVGGGVDHHVGVGGLKQLVDAESVGDIELVATQRREVMVGPVGGGPDDVGAELAAGAGEENAHQRFLTEALSGSHQARFSVYQATVASRASSKLCVGAQPRSRILVVSML